MVNNNISLTMQEENFILRSAFILRLGKLLNYTWFEVESMNV